MKFSAVILLLLLILSISNSGFSQNSVQSDKKKEIEDLWLARKAQIKADILKEIGSLPSKRQAEYYAKLGREFLYRKENKEAAFWIAKALEIAFNPATEYKDTKEKINVVEDILVFHDILENEEELFKNPLAKITAILFEEVNEKRSDEYGEIIISLAAQLLKKDEKLAFELASLSLKGNKPALDSSAFSFFVESRKKNEILFNQYFAKSLEVVKLSGNKEYLKGILVNSFDRFRNGRPNPPQNISDAQKRDLLDVLAPFIQKESEELLQKNANDCKFTAFYGKRFLEDYRKILPQNAGNIEQAINICQTSAIDFWKKPHLNRPLKTVQDILDIAKEVGDKQIRANFTFRAATVAYSEKNYRLSIEILDGIDEDLIEKLNGNWEVYRIQSTADLIQGLLFSEKLIEAKQVIENSPPEIRPFIILRALDTTTKNKQTVFDLLKRVKAEIFKLQIAVPTNSFYNFARYHSPWQLIHFYNNLGYKDEAMETFEEYILFINKLNKRFASENINAEKFPLIHYYSLGKDFMETYFQRIYQNIESIEALPIRLNFRLGLFREHLNNTPFNPQTRITVTTY